MNERKLTYEELEQYRKKARYVMFKLHKDLEELTTINTALQATITQLESKLGVKPRPSRANALF